MRAAVEEQIEAESQAFFLSGRIYDDGVIDPRDTRSVLGMCLSVIDGAPASTIGQEAFSPGPGPGSAGRQALAGAGRYGVFRM
jgi:acetyl-CoA carboxylase carboxyltransferase component